MNRRLSAWWLTTTLLIWPLLARGQSDPGLPHGAISGTVLFEADNRPAEGVKVRLQLYTGGAVPDVFTRPGGDFEFTQLFPGTYVVVVDEPGYQRIEETVRLTDLPISRLLLNLRKSPVELSSRASSLVSVRELSMPRGARNAFQKGIERLGKKDPAGSLVHFQRAAVAFPNYYEAHYEMGVAQMTLGHDDEAEQAFQRSIEISGGHYPMPHFGLGILLCDQKRFAEAEPIIRKGLELDTNSGLGHFALAQALFGLNRLDEAENNAREALMRLPKFASAHVVLANIYIRRHNHVALLAELEAYLKLEPNGARSAQARQMRGAINRSVARSEDILPAAPTKP